MEAAGDILELFDSWWFEMEIFKIQSSSSKSSSSSHEARGPDVQNQETRPISRLPTITRSMSEQLSVTTSLASSFSSSQSPDSVFHTPKLQTILSAKEIVDEEEQTEENSKIPKEVVYVQESYNKKRFTSRRSGKRSLSKSMSELEFEELKGFMDLGFVFSEEDKESSLASIIPGLQRLGKNDSKEEQSRGTDEEKSRVSRPYLSEAWEVLDNRMMREDPLTNWRIPAVSNEMDMKDSLKWWAHSVASSVR